VEDGELRPLRGGRHNLPPEVVAFNQRERLLAAVAQVVAERGYGEMTVADVIRLASVSRRTFYEHFKNKEVAFLAAYDAVDDHLHSVLAAAAESRDEWADRVVAVISALIDFFAGRPDLARLYLVEALAVGDAFEERAERSTTRLSELLAARGTAGDPERQPAEGMEEAIAGGLLASLRRRVAAGEAERLRSLTAASIEFALSPYLGAERARSLAATCPTDS
jgi:AcrR family transcriptional regulator